MKQNTVDQFIFPIVEFYSMQYFCLFSNVGKTVTCCCSSPKEHKSLLRTASLLKIL